jgi:hypothetical protein
MNRSHQYSLLVISVLCGLAHSQRFSTDEHSSGTTISTMFTPEMLLLSPELQGTFARNYFWPGLFRDSIIETGIQFEGSQMMNLSVQGSAKVGRCLSGLQLYGFDHNTNNTQSVDENYDNDSVETERKYNHFSIGGKFYCIPFLFLKNGISAECSYSRYSNNTRDTEWDSTGYNEPYKTNELEQTVFVHARGVHRLSRRQFLYAEWWMDLNDTVYETGFSYSLPKKKFSMSMGFLAGFSSIIEGNYNWHISAGNESYMRRTNYSYYEIDNPFNRWVVEGEFMKEMHFGELTQFTGAKLRLFPILTQQEKEDSRDPGLEFTVPLLLKYSPVSKVTFYTGSNISLTFQHHNAGLHPGNVTFTSYDLSPIAVQWTPTKHHCITVVPEINDKVISGSFEWRYRF